MKKLFKFYWDCGRSGSLEGLFFATQEQVDAVIDKDVYFGEALGKHSEVYGTIEAGDIEEVPLPEEAVAALLEHLGEDVSGYNPLNYLEDEDEDADDT